MNNKKNYSIMNKSDLNIGDYIEILEGPDKGYSGIITGWGHGLWITIDDYIHVTVDKIVKV
jgi:ribosomal protein L24